MSKKSIEEIYQLKDEISHILQRGEMYVGANTPRLIKTPVIVENHIEEREIEYTPALMKIIDEIISNSTDERTRNIEARNKLPKRQQKSFHVLDTLRIDVKGSKVTIYDNGGIPVAFHKEQQTYLPTMLFGNLRAGSNFDDDSNDRKTTGKNGVGSALTNVYSTYFQVTTCDGLAKFDQKWLNNSRDVMDPNITLIKGKRYGGITYPTKGVYYKKGTKMEKILKPQIDKVSGTLERGTTIHFDIDFSRFPEEDEIGDGILKMLEYRAIVAAAANPGLKVYFNDRLYEFNTFTEFVNMHTSEDDMIYHHSDSDWEICVVPTLINAGNISHSFVNGNSCNMGTHVDYLNSLVVKSLTPFLKKKKLIHKPLHIRKQYKTFINLKVVNPVYDAQTKEVLETPYGQYKGIGKSSAPKVSAKFLKSLEKSDIIENMILLNDRSDSEAEKKQLEQKNKEMKKKNPKTIKKLKDAELKRGREKCELWIYEGDSAASNFINVRDAKIHGAYKLRGKCMNTLYAKQSKIAANQELSDIMMSIGLRFNGEWDIKNIRYGKIIIATDADVDGISITGQLLTFFNTHFPELIEAGILYGLMSPRYKVTKNRGKSIQYFYTDEEFKKANTKASQVEYFKGLGSLSEDEYYEMVNNPRLIKFGKDSLSNKTIEVWMGDDAEPRKQYLENN